MRSPVAHIALLVVVAVAVFANAMSNGFQLDDMFRVVTNRAVYEPEPLRCFTDPSASSSLPRIVQYRPLLPLSLSANFAVSGMDPFGFHVGNLLLQILASIAVYFVLCELLAHWLPGASRPDTWALLAAVMFAVHPVSGVLVNYICARDLIMSVGFAMAALLAYLRMRRDGVTTFRWGLCLALFLCALLSKKNAVVLPAIVLLFEVTLGGRRITDKVVWRSVLPFALVAAALFALVQFGLGFSDAKNAVSGAAGPYLRAQVQYHLFHYLANFAWPFEIRPLAAEPVVEWKVVVGGLAIVGSWVLAWKWWRRKPLLVFCLLGYQISIALTSSVIPMHSMLVPYRPYPASMFFYTGLVALLMPLGGRGVAVAVALVLWFAGTSVAMNPIWKSGQTLLTHSVAHGGNKMAYNGLCDYLPPSEERARLYREALKLDPNYAEATLGLGITEVALGRVSGGLSLVERVIRLAPGIAQFRDKAAEAYTIARRYPQAFEQAKKAVELDPSSHAYRVHAAELALSLENNEAALALLEPVVTTQPGFDRASLFAGIALHRLKKFKTAHRYLEAFAGMHPENGAAHYQLGVTRVALSQWRPAVEAFESALRVQPGLVDAHRQLAACYGQIGDEGAASKHRALHAEMQRARKER